MIATEQVHDCLKYLASVCDYAGSQDKRGMNKLDTTFGHDLASKPTLTYGQALAALKMLKKYQRQLSNAGLTLPESIPAPTHTQESFRLNGQGGITLSGDTLYLSFPSIPSESDRSFLKTFKNWRYDPATHKWSVPAVNAEKVLAQFPNLPADHSISAKQREMEALAEAEEEKRQSITAALIAAAGDLSERLPCGQPLYRHQQEAVTRCLANWRQILALDMGTGKSRTALAVAKAWQHAFDTITYVVGPVSLKENWMREAEAVGVAIEYYSWAKVPQSPEKPFVVICDEAHAMQSLKAQRTQKALELTESAESALFLTGTPMRNARPSNLYPLLKATRHVLAEDRKYFEVRYCAAKATRWSKWDITGAANLTELHEKTKNVIIRKTKAECLDLPALTRVQRKVEVSESAAKAYHDTFTDLRTEYKRRLATGEIMSGGEALVMLNHLRHAGSVAKAENAIELAEEVIEQGSQVILFTAFQDSAKQIAATLGCELLTGETDTKDRQPMVDRFNAGQHKAIVCTIGAGGVGLNMQAANTVVMVDRGWVPADFDQCESRAHRSGQLYPVTSLWLQMNSTDEAIDALLLQKQERITLVLAGKRKTMRGASGSVADVAHEVLDALFN